MLTESPDESPDAQREMLSLVTARVRDAHVRRPFYVDGAMDLVSVCRALSQSQQTVALVRDGDRLGIFTTTDLRDALLHATPPQALPVREVARFGLIEVAPNAELFEALWLMVRHRVHRLLVREGTQVLGVLAQLDLVSFVANHSHLVALQIDEAESVEALRGAAQRIEAMTLLLHDGGTRIERIARLVGELNRRLFARTWALVAPPEVVADTCLLVMGSEGRGEQILRTDQDNALLVRDGGATPAVEAAAQRFHDALVSYGWPPCPGHIMVTNPLWRAELSAFRETLRGWLAGHDREAPMHLAIFLDAVVVAGDERLLAEARTPLDGPLLAHDVFHARFAAPADQFEEPVSWWQRLTGRDDEQPLDLKKLGTFPIVHGLRALALQQRIAATGSAARLAALVERQALDAGLGRDLLEALHYLMGLKLRHQLAQRAAGERPTQLVRPSDLSTMDRDQLKDALAIVRRFRGLLRQRFRLDAVS